MTAIRITATFTAAVCNGSLTSKPVKLIAFDPGRDQAAQVLGAGGGGSVSGLKVITSPN
jgi:hypothetical protein